MRVSVLAGLSLALFPVVAVAQNGVSGAKSALPLADFSVRQQCIMRSDVSPQPKKGSDAHELRLTPLELSQGYAVTGGGCEQFVPPGSPMLTYGHVISSAPLAGPRRPGEPEGWQCKVGAPPGTPSADYFRVKTHLVACRSVFEEGLLGTQARWRTPGDGTQVTVLRSGADLDKPVPHSIKICPRTGAYPLTVSWRIAAKPGDIALEPPPVDVKVGQCFEIDQPAEVLVRQVKAFPGEISGTYELFRKGTYSTTAAVRDAYSSKSRSQDETNRKKPLTYAAPTAVTASCEPVGKPEDYPPGEAQWRACALPLGSGQRDIRVCFGDDMIDAAPGGRPDYAVSLIGMVMDKALVKRDPKVNADPWKWNAIFPNTCRDLFNADFASILVMSGDPVWLPANVNGIRMTVQDIGGK